MSKRRVCERDRALVARFTRGGGDDVRCRFAVGLRPIVAGCAAGRMACVIHDRAGECRCALVARIARRGSRHVIVALSECRRAVACRARTCGDTGVIERSTCKRCSAGVAGSAIGGGHRHHSFDNPALASAPSRPLVFRQLL